MYSDEIKKNCRTIHTGLKGRRMLAVLESVEGQLSDGIWENSPRMEGYWLFDCVGLEGDEVCIYISNKYAEYRFDRVKRNLFMDMSDREVIQWFAKKIKQIVKQEIDDNWNDHPIEWDRNCDTVCMYMHDDLTVKECYEAYDILLGRK